MNKKKTVIIALVAVAAVAAAVVIALTAMPKETAKKTKDKTEQQAKEDHTNEVRSLLTGEWVDKEIGQKRPVAIMTENTKDAVRLKFRRRHL